MRHVESEVEGTIGIITIDHLAKRNSQGNLSASAEAYSSPK